MRTVGGTLVGQILGVSPWGGPLSAYYALSEGHEPQRNSEMDRGNVLEDSVLSLLAQREGLRVFAGERLTHEHRHATLDGIASTPDGRCVVEAKTANDYDGTEWGPDGSDEVPPQYHLQALWYMGVSRAVHMRNADHALLPVLQGPEAELRWAARMVERTAQPLRLADLDGTGLEFRVHRIPWDEEMFQAMDAKVRTFLAEHVEPRHPPMPGPGDLLTERDMDAVRRRKATGEVLHFERLGTVEQALLLELAEASTQERAWGRTLAQVRARVQLLMGGAEEVRGVPGLKSLTWKDTAQGRRFIVRESK